MCRHVPACSTILQTWSCQTLLTRINDCEEPPPSFHRPCVDEISHAIQDCARCTSVRHLLVFSSSLINVPDVPLSFLSSYRCLERGLACWFRSFCDAQRVRTPLAFKRSSFETLRGSLTKRCSVTPPQALETHRWDERWDVFCMPHNEACREVSEGFLLHPPKMGCKRLLIVIVIV